MQVKPDNKIFHYLLTLCLGVALLFAQTNKLHMHTQHDEHTPAHVLGVHAASTHHHTPAHHDGLQTDHHKTAVDIGSNNLAKNTNLLNPLVLLLLFIGLLLYIPVKAGLCNRWIYNTRVTLCFYLYLPPLRAPPIK